MKEAPATKTALQENLPPPHPLDAAIDRLMGERLALKLGKASQWQESKISILCHVISGMPANSQATNELFSIIGKWVFDAFDKRDSDALLRLTECWNSGGYDGIPHIAGSAGKLGRKDLEKCRNVVFGKILENGKAGIPFDDWSIRLIASFQGCKISDETLQTWRNQLLGIFDEAFKGKARNYFCAGRYFLKLKVGAKKGARQEHRVRSEYSGKLGIKKRRKPDN